MPLPDPEDALAPHHMEDGRECPPRMAPGTFAVDPRPYGVPAVENPGPGSPDGVGECVPVDRAVGIVLSPADVRHTSPSPIRVRRSGCCGPSGSDGPNLVCAGCGTEIATEAADCWTAQEVILLATAVRPHGENPGAGTGGR
ncbi:hypothetical protein GCM10027160_26910 [Streptomyces calidiresistens]